MIRPITEIYRVSSYNGGEIRKGRLKKRPKHRKTYSKDNPNIDAQTRNIKRKTTAYNYKMQGTTREKAYKGRGYSAISSVRCAGNITYLRKGCRAMA